MSWISFASGGAISNATTTTEALTAQTVTANASANTKGSASTSLGTTAAAWSGFYVYLYNAANSAHRYLVDISFDNGSTWAVSDLFCHPATATTGTPLVRYFIPLQVASGAVVVARCQASTGASSVTCWITGEVADSDRPPGFTVFEALNIDTTNTRPSATDVALNGGSWVSLVDPTSNAYSAILSSVGDNGAMAAANQFLVQLAAGTSGGGGETEFARYLGSVASSVPLPRMQASPLFPVSVASGARISAQTSGAASPGTDSVRIGLYGLR